MTDQEFTDEQVDLDIDYVARHGAQNRGKTVTYTHVLEAAGLPDARQLHHSGDGHLVTAFMEAFHYRCGERGYPPLDSLVVNVAGDRGDLPGIGYFRVNGWPDPMKPSTGEADAIEATKSWQAQKDECRRWGDAQRRSRG